MYRIGIEFQFESAHYLPNVPDGHKCKQLHGHNYILLVELESDTLDERGFIVDYFELRPIKDWINETIDHRLLNDVFPNPTVEIMAKEIYERFKQQFPQISKVTLKETPTTFASYYE